MREIKFKRLFQHEETGRICEIMWGNIDSNGEPYEHFEGFKSPAHISGYTVVADRQFTGLKDKNGKEIYEGDIVRSVCDKLMPKKTSEENMFKLPVFEKKTFHNVIDWYDGIRISGWRIKGNRFQAQLKWSTVGNMQLEVIGTIYENPELLNN